MINGENFHHVRFDQMTKAGAGDYVWFSYNGMGFIFCCCVHVIYIQLDHATTYDRVGFILYSLALMSEDPYSILLL